MTTFVNKLSDLELNAWVAKALGMNIVGKALASYDPECCSPCIASEQKIVTTGIGKTHERYFCVDECKCDIYNQTQEEINTLIHEYGSNSDPDVIVLGHNMFCLQPVYDYCSDFSDGMKVVEQYRIAITPYGDKQWKAHKNHIIAIGNTPMNAAMQAFVQDNFGESVDNNLLLIHHKFNT